MSKLKTACFLSLLLVAEMACASNADSSNYLKSIKKNSIEAEFLGVNYQDPFYERITVDAPVSLNYSRLFIRSNFSWRFSFGLSTFRSFYVDENHISHRPWALCLPVGFVWRHHYQRNGFWLGIFFSPAFVKQQHTADIIYTRDFDYQVVPDFNYQFQSKKGSFVCKISYTPKITSGVFSESTEYQWRVLPLWFGLSIGGAW